MGLFHSAMAFLLLLSMPHVGVTWLSSQPLTNLSRGLEHNFFLSYNCKTKGLGNYLNWQSLNWEACFIIFSSSIPLTATLGEEERKIALLVLSVVLLRYCSFLSGSALSGRLIRILLVLFRNLVNWFRPHDKRIFSIRGRDKPVEQIKEIKDVL